MARVLYTIAHPTHIYVDDDRLEMAAHEAYENVASRIANDQKEQRVFQNDASVKLQVLQRCHEMMTTQIEEVNAMIREVREQTHRTQLTCRTNEGTNKSLNERFSRDFQGIRGLISEANDATERALNISKNCENKIDEYVRKSQDIDTILEGLKREVKEASAEAVYCRTASETRAIEIGNDVLQLQELVQRQVQEFRSALQAIEKGQDETVEAAVATAVQSARTAVSIAEQNIEQNVHEKLKTMKAGVQELKQGVSSFQSRMLSIEESVSRAVESVRVDDAEEAIVGLSAQFTDLKSDFEHSKSQHQALTKVTVADEVAKEAQTLRGESDAKFVIAAVWSS